MWTTGTTTVGGLRLHQVRTGGDLRPVVMAHGLGDSGPCWTRLARALAGDHDVVLYDARGHGGSDRASSYAFADQVADLVAVVEAVAKGPVTLVGHSMGGAHAAAVAARRPDLVNGLVLEDPHWPARPEDPASYDLPGWQARLAANRNRSFDELIAEGERDNPAWHADDLRPWVRAQQAVDPAVPSWLNSVAEIAGWRDDVAAISCPTLLVAGDPDVTVSPALAAEAARRCPSLTVVRIPGAGHSIRRDRFTAFLDAVSPFLAKVWSAS